ncbi:MAG: hydrogenase maturation protease, partial [Wenzhouxiangellaceae bacterium]
MIDVHQSISARANYDAGSRPEEDSMQAMTRHIRDTAPGTRPVRHPRPVQVTVIGIGNTLMGDDGAGVHVVENLKQRLGNRVDPNQIRLLDGGTLSFTLLDEVEQT